MLQIMRLQPETLRIMSDPKTIRLRRVDADAIVEQMEFLAGKINECYGQMSPAAKLVALDLSAGFYRLKCRLTKRPRRKGRPSTALLMRRAALKAEARQ